LKFLPLELADAFAHSCNGNHGSNRKVLKISGLVVSELEEVSAITEISYTTFRGLSVKGRDTVPQRGHIWLGIDK